MNESVNPILRDELAQLNRQFIKNIVQAKELFNTPLCGGARSSGYRNKICQEYGKQVEKLGECIFNHLTSNEKNPQLFSNVFSNIYGQLKQELKLDLDGNRDIGLVDQVYKQTLDRYIYQINLSLQKTNDSYNKEKSSKDTIINNSSIDTLNLFHNESTSNTKVSQSNTKTINPEPESISFLFKKIWSYVVNLFK